MLKVKVANPAKIAVCDAPIRPDSKIQHLTPEQVGKKFGFSFDESIYVQEGSETRYAEDFNTLGNLTPPVEQPTHEALQKLMQTPFDGLVLCEMPHPTGFGIFTTKPILEGTPICFYGGIIGPLEEHNTYLLSLSRVKQDPSLDIPGISAKNQGGLARFLQHLPIDEERRIALQREKLPLEFSKRAGIPLEQVHQRMKARGIDTTELLKNLSQSFNTTNDVDDLMFENNQSYEKLAYANVSSKRVQHNGIILPVIVADCDIPAYSQLGFSYGKSMWQSLKTKPVIFDQSGNVMSGTVVSYKLSDDEKAISKAAKAHHKQALEYYTQKNFTQALEYELLAQSEFVQTASYYCIENATSYSVLASIYREQGKVNEAIEAVASGVAIAETLNKPFKQGYQKLTAILEKLETKNPDLEKAAVKHFKKGHHKLAHTLFSGLLHTIDKDSADYATCLYNTASCHKQLGQDAQAQDFYQQAAEHAKCPKHLLEKIEAKNKAKLKA